MTETPKKPQPPQTLGDLLKNKIEAENRRAEQQKAADRIIDILVGDAPYSEEDDAEWGVPKALLDTAGQALAGRYIFAVEEMEGEISVLTTPLRYFEKNGCCDDQTGPIGHLIPKGGELMESTWEIYDDSVKTAGDAAKYMQDQGFVWNRDFQNFIDSSVTAEIEQALKPAAQDKPAQNRGAKPKF